MNDNKKLPTENFICFYKERGKFPVRSNFTEEEKRLFGQEIDHLIQEVTELMFNMEGHQNHTFQNAADKPKK